MSIRSNFDVIDTGSKLDVSEQLLLDSYTVRISVTAWQLQPGALLAANEQGRDILKLREFLLARSVDALPDTVERLLSDTARRANLLQDRGAAWLIECANAGLAQLIAHDKHCKKFCLLAGDRYLVVQAGNDNLFRVAVRKIGYSFPAI